MMYCNRNSNFYRFIIIPKLKIQIISNEIQMTKYKKIYNLEERTALFGENIIEFCKSIKQNNINKSILNQLIRSGTSIGANYLPH